MLHTTKESLEETQPLCNEDESLMLVMDGWLSNWTELRSELIARGSHLRTRSDAELVLRAYEVWGEDCPQHIDGEFAFVIWDQNRREAFVAGDHVGLKPLHYHWDGRQLVVASDIVGVLAMPGFSREPNLARISEYLKFEWGTRGQTIWKGVSRAVPAHSMRFRNGHCESRKYWEPPLETTIFYKRDEEYFEHYRHLFTECVRRASRTHKPLACDVSGGLDSSAVFAMAHELRRKGTLPAPGVKGYTYFFKDAEGTEHDEIEYARATARHLGVALKEVPPFLPDMQWFLERGRMDCDIAGYPNGAMSIAIGKTLVADGCRVSLNGEGGDEFLAGTRFYFAEQLAAREWGKLSQTFIEDTAEIGLRKTAWNLLRFGLAPMLPVPVLEVLRNLRERRRIGELDKAAWIKAELRNSANLKGLRPGHELMQLAKSARRCKHLVLNDPFALVVWDQFSRQSARVGYEIRTPMYAREFIDFSFATPERIRLRGERRKFIHVRALEGLLPEVVANRKTKADFGIAFTRLLEMVKSHLMDAVDGDGSDYLDKKGLARLFERQQAEPDDFRLVWHVWTLFELNDILMQNEN